MEPEARKPKLEIFDLATTKTRSTQEVVNAYKEAIKVHPFYDNAHSIADVYMDGVLRDGRGNVLAVLIRQGLPEFAASMAADVLRAAATKTSLRASIYGGEAPNSGVAGYFDYRGSPIEFKCRKTAFTHDHQDTWHNVFPMVDYVSEIYRRVVPHHWARQSAAIPDIVRIHGSPFSTLTINSRFRTASHTDAGDFDAGYGCLACLEGQFKGICLTFDDFRVNFRLQPRDVLVFNTHHFHSNTELESCNQDLNDWSRLTVVFYYRSVLGEPSSMAEYRRRLLTAKQIKASPPPVVDEIVNKDNGENHYRPDPVYPLELTPFAVIASLCCMRLCASKALYLHRWLLQSPEAAALLFGEPLSRDDGLPDRATEDVCSAQGGAAVRTPSTGGFTESPAMLQAAAKNEGYLHHTHLSQCITEELFDLWQEARARWLRLVAADWAKLIARNPNRQDFLWANHSEMNAAFFDLCTVAKQVMLDLLGSETPTAAESQSFWILYATHLHKACISELHLPESAMSMRKLNVKLKDFQFGGTRYFKDMPPEEQKRRLIREQRIEEARRMGTRSNGKKSSDWLQCDGFDYQTEDRPVDYAGHGWVLPEEHARSVAPDLSGGPPEVCSDDEAIEVLVVLPLSRFGAPLPTQMIGKSPQAEEELTRLMGNAAAQALMTGPRANATLPKEVRVGGLHIRFAFCGQPPNGCFDFIVLQHVLCAMSDDAAESFVQAMTASTRGSLLVVETDAQDRRYFVLKNDIRAAYDEVAVGCFQEMLQAHYGVAGASVRSKAVLEHIVGNCCARYKFQGSPLNSMLLLVAGTATQK